MNDRTDEANSNSRYRVAVRRGARIGLNPHRTSPDPNDNNRGRAWLKSKPRPWAIDLFCGAGGLSVGLEEGGFRVAAADSDPVATETHAANIQGLTWTGNLSNPSEFLRQLDNWGIENVDLLAGGPPCQPFSTAGLSKIGDLVRRGSRRPRDERSDLWRRRSRSAATLTEGSQPSAPHAQDRMQFPLEGVEIGDSLVLRCDRSYGLH